MFRYFFCTKGKVEMNFFNNIHSYLPIIKASIYFREGRVILYERGEFLSYSHLLEGRGTHYSFVISENFIAFPFTFM